MVNNELISVKKEGETFKVMIRTAKNNPFQTAGGISPTYDNFVELKFKSKKEALIFYKTNKDENLFNCKDNKERLTHIPPTLSELKSFVEIIEKTKCLSKRNNDKISAIIQAYNSRLNLVNAISEAEQIDSELDIIIKAINNFKE